MSCICPECGCSPALNSEWRWDGQRWTHWHGILIGHVRTIFAEPESTDFNVETISKGEPVKSPVQHRIDNAVSWPLGKRAPRIDKRTFKLTKYLPKLPSAPASVEWLPKLNWGVMLNDSIGDCTCAAAGHMIEQWSALSGVEFRIPDSSILIAYQAVSGYVPGEPQTDNGAVMLDVLNYWRQNGIGGHKILAYVSVNLKNQNEVKTAVQLFGNIYLGVQLPISAQGASVWSVPDAGPVGDGSPGSWGGHCIPIMGYAPTVPTTPAASPLVYTVLTWGKPVHMTSHFLNAYADEAYCVLSSDWIDKNGLAPSGFNLAQLQADLASL